MTSGSGTSEWSGLPPRYRTEELVSRTRHRAVFRGRDLEANRLIFVKKLDKRMLAPGEIDRIREVQAVVSGSACANIVPIDEIIDSDRYIFLVSPFLTGGDLETRIAARSGKPLPLDDALRIAIQLCRALEGIHAAGVCHRDVTSSNVFFDDCGEAWLGDFGLAIVMAAASDAGVSGTPAYMPPESLWSHPQDASGDLYSLGCLLYEMTTGRLPFLGDHASEILRLHQVGRAIPPCELNPALPRLLSDLILKLLEKEPAQRPALISDVRSALEGIVRAGPASTPVVGIQDSAWKQRLALPLPFMDRESEMTALCSALERCRYASPSVVLVTGEAGAGKSRLLDEFAARADALGCGVVRGQGDEHAVSSYQPFADALRPMSGHLSLLETPHADLVRDLVDHHHGSDSEPGRLRSSHEERLFAAVWAALAAFSSRRALVLMLDDLHAFDHPSLQLFDHLMHAIAVSADRSGGLLIVASTRPSSSSRLQETLAGLRLNLSCPEIQLNPFDDSAVYELLTALGAAHPSTVLVHEIVAATEGNPLFVSEVAKLLGSAGYFEDSTARTLAHAAEMPLRIPATVIEAIAERIYLLSSKCREMLIIASLLGTRFELQQLSVASGCYPDSPAESLDEAVANGILAIDATAYRFAHPLIRRGVLDLIGVPEERRLHLSIASRLREPSRDGSHDGSPGRTLEVAHHLVRAGSLADPADVVSYAGRAGRQALARFAWHEAAELLDAAIDAVHRSASPNLLELAELHQSAGLAYFRLHESKPCLEHYDAAVSAFGRADCAAGVARAQNDRVRVALWLGEVSYGQMGMIAPLEQALGQLGSDHPALRAQILNTLAEAHWAARRGDEAEKLAVASLELGRAVGSYRQCAEASIDLGLARFMSLRADQALETWRSGAEYARRAQDIFSEERCLVRSALALTATARIDEAERVIQHVNAMNQTLQLPGESSIASGVLLTIATLKGDFDAAERYADEALDRVRRSRYPWTTMLCAPTLACARALRNDVPGAARAIRALFESNLGFDDPALLRSPGLYLRWIADWFAGDISSIEMREVEGLSSELEGHSDLTTFSAACAIAELADAFQEPRWAALASLHLEVAHRQGFVFWCAWPFFVPRLRGVVAALMGETDVAEILLTRAIQIAQGVQAHIELARAQLDLARLLATRNLGHDRVRACELVAASCQRLRAGGPAVFSDRAERLRAFLSESREAGVPTFT